MCHLCRAASNQLSCLQAIVTELAENDIDHVRVLRQELGDAAVPIPQLDIGVSPVSAPHQLYYVVAAGSRFGKTCCGQDSAK